MFQCLSEIRYRPTAPAPCPVECIVKRKLSWFLFIWKGTDFEFKNNVNVYYKRLLRSAYSLDILQVFFDRQCDEMKTFLWFYHVFQCIYLRISDMKLCRTLILYMRHDSIMEVQSALNDRLPYSKKTLNTWKSTKLL